MFGDVRLPMRSSRKCSYPVSNGDFRGRAPAPSMTRNDPLRLAILTTFIGGRPPPAHLAPTFPARFPRGASALDHIGQGQKEAASSGSRDLNAGPLGPQPTGPTCHIQVELKHRTRDGHNPLGPSDRSPTAATISALFRPDPPTLARTHLVRRSSSGLTRQSRTLFGLNATRPAARLVRSPLPSGEAPHRRRLGRSGGADRRAWASTPPRPARPCRGAGTAVPAWGPRTSGTLTSGGPDANAIPIHITRLDTVETSTTQLPLPFRVRPPLGPHLRKAQRHSQAIPQTHCVIDARQEILHNRAGSTRIKSPLFHGSHGHFSTSLRSANERRCTIALRTCCNSKSFWQTELGTGATQSH